MSKGRLFSPAALTVIFRRQSYLPGGTLDSGDRPASNGPAVLVRPLWGRGVSAAASKVASAASANRLFTGTSLGKRRQHLPLEFSSLRAAPSSRKPNRSFLSPGMVGRRNAACAEWRSGTG